MAATFLLVDFENVHQVTYSSVPMECRVKVFVGRTQNSIPFVLTHQCQKFGERLEWIKIDGDGHNNLDFHLCYYLGALSTSHPTARFFILSGDKGFEPLLRHLAKVKVRCQRISNLSELTPSGGGGDSERKSEVAWAVELLTKSKKARPRRRTTLLKYLASHLKVDAGSERVKQIVDGLIVSRKVSETEQGLGYDF